MIGRLKGILLEKQPPHVLLDVSGVGYEVQVPMSTLYQLPELGQTVTLLTHLTVREDAHLLFGFSTSAERQLFRRLIKVNGVGPKLALAILSSMSPDEFVLCIQAQDLQRLVKMPGVGKKTAERLIVEMQDALKEWQCSDGQLVSMQQAPASAIQEATSALVALGYSAPQAKRCLASLPKDLSAEDYIRQALKHMVPESTHA